MQDTNPIPATEDSNHASSAESLESPRKSLPIHAFKIEEITLGVGLRDLEVYMGVSPTFSDMPLEGLPTMNACFLTQQQALVYAIENNANHAVLQGIVTAFKDRESAITQDGLDAKTQTFYKGIRHDLIDV